MYKGATHLSQTSIPIGGNNTNSVIAAHRGLIRNKMFRNIDKLGNGDIIKINNMWGELTYKVIKTEVIHPTNINEILIQKDKDLITLVTCHPYRVNTHRYIVICERVAS